MYRRLFAIAAGVLLVGASPAAALNAAQPGIVSKVPAQGTPAVLDGVVNAVAQVGNTVIVGGQFTRVMETGGHVLQRTDIFAFDATTGLVDPAFAPTVANGQVSTLSAGPDGASVFAGGTFDTVNGQPEKRLVKLSLADGSIVPGFHAALMGSWVEDSDVRGNRLYIGGAITSVNGVARGRSRRRQCHDGAVDPNVALNFTDKRAGKLRVAHFDISPDGTKLVATGTFTKVDGLDRNQIAMIDLSTTPASVSSWQTDAFTPACATRFDTYIRDVSFAPDGSYFVVANTGAWFGGANAGVLCDSVQRWESGATGPGQLPTWVDYTGGDSLTQVAATGVGGLRRRPPALPEQPVRRRHRRAGRREPDGHRRARSAERPPLHVEPRPLPARLRRVGVPRDARRPLGRKRHRLRRLRLPPAPRPPAAGRGEEHPAGGPGALPGDLYTVGAGATPMRRTSTARSPAPPRPSPASASLRRTSAGRSCSRASCTSPGATGTSTCARSTAPPPGTPKTIDLHGLTAGRLPVSKLTGMFFADGRLYYTVNGDRHLFWRWFEPQSRLIGAQRFVESAGTPGLAQRCRGMTAAGGPPLLRSRRLALCDGLHRRRSGARHRDGCQRRRRGRRPGVDRPRPVRRLAILVRSLLEID